MDIYMCMNIVPPREAYNELGVCPHSASDTALVLGSTRPLRQRAV